MARYTKASLIAEIRDAHARGAITAGERGEMIAAVQRAKSVAEAASIVHQHARSRANPPRRKNWPRAAEADPVAATELVIYVTNDGSLYRTSTSTTIGGLATIAAKGNYDIRKAQVSWGRIATQGAQLYCKEHCGRAADWSEVFSASTRRLAAADLEEHYREEVMRRAGARKNSAKGARRKARKPAKRRNPMKSVSYGTYVPTAVFIRKALAAEGRTKYPYTLRGGDDRTAERARIPSSGSFTPLQLHTILVKLKRRFDKGDDEAGDLASSICYTLGVEWV